MDNHQASVKLQIDSVQVSEKIQEMINSEELILLDDVNCDFTGKIIELVGSEQSVLTSQQIIISVEQQLKSKLIKRPLDLKGKEALFFIKKILPLKQDFYDTRFKCTIEVIEDKVSSKNLIASTLSYENKELHIAYADISKFPCDAIVNSCNNLMSLKNVDIESGVAKNIFDMAGPCYSQFCESYIQENKTLEFGKAITYKMPAQLNGIQKFIINVQTPIYQNGEQEKQDYQKIEQNIKAIFAEANKLNIKTLALPIFGGGACGYSFKQIAQNVINYIINALYSQDNKIVQKVYVTELAEQKLTQLCQVLIKTIEHLRRKFNKQRNQFQDYDDEEINKQIDEGYVQFLNQGQTLELQLVLPFAKQPGTHLVDLQQMIITDRDIGTKIQLSLKTDQRKDRYLFDNLEIDDEINEYLILQKQSNNHQFQISYQKNRIIYNSNGDIQQLNEVTGCTRKVQYIPYKKNQQQAPKNILTGKNVVLQQRNDDQLLNQKSLYKVFVESFDNQVINNLENKIREDIIKHTTEFKFTLPLIKQEDLKSIKDFILQKSIKQLGEIESGKEVVVRILQSKQLKFQAQIDTMLENTFRYPTNWNNQNINAIKVELSSDSQEYKEIEAEFRKSEQGNISKIYRLQNQTLWEYYQSEFKKLEDISIQRNTPLTQMEQKRYLWHAINQPGFELNYSNAGEWGQGMYFSEQASYQRAHTYKLTQQDDPLYAGQLKLLFCQVATGKVATSNANGNLRRPPAGFDCVSGLKNGSYIFILYQMDVRRAYPAYEIIYQ